MVVAYLVRPQGKMSDTIQRTGRFTRWLRAPLLHFALIGGSFYLVTENATSSIPAPIIVSESDLASHRSEWSRSTGRAPNPAELERLIARQIDDEVLIREARRLGWDRNDAVIQQRLIRNLRFLDPETSESDGTLLERAYAMGMHERDLVVRRRLIERIKLAVAARVRSQPIPADRLEAYRLEHAERFMRPPLVRLTQIYLSRDLRGTALSRDAGHLAEKLKREHTLPEQARLQADPFLIPADLPLWSSRKLRERLGERFAEGVQDAPLGAWSDPITSSYGAHVVWVHDRIPEVLPPLAEVLVQVKAEINRERESEALRELIAKLREGILIEMADAAPSQTR